MKPKKEELTISKLEVYNHQLHIGKPQKPPKYLYPCHDNSAKTTDFSSWSYFRNHPTKVCNIGSSHLWNRQTLSNITDRSYMIPTASKQEISASKKFPSPRPTRAERLRRNYLISMTPTLEDEISIAYASKGAETISQDFSIESGGK